MNNRISWQDLASGLAKRKGMGKREAESFVHSVFAIIEEKVIADGIVKVKGLGVFKTVSVDSRKSVDVNTGERIVINSHTRISFAPHATLRTAVNRPFSDFETVVLSGDTDTAEMEYIPAQDEEEPEREEQQTDVAERAGQDQEEERAPLQAEDAAAQDANEETANNVETEQKPSAPALTQLDIQRAVSAALNEELARRKGSAVSWGWVVACVLLAAMLAAGSFYLGDKYGKYFIVTGEAQSEAVTVDEARERPHTAVAEEGNAAKEASAKRQPEQTASDFTDKYPQVEDGEYWITGTMEEHTIVVGDNLTALSLKVYGGKEFAQYIIVYNNIKDPSHIEIGRRLKLPELRKRE